MPIVVQSGDEALQTAVDIDDASAFARIEREGRLPNEVVVAAEGP